MPQWQVTLKQIPLIGADTLIIGEQFADSSLVTDSDSLYHILFSGATQLDVSAMMKLPAMNPAPITGNIQNVHLNGMEQLFHFNIYQIFPQFQQFNNTSAAIPPVRIQVQKAFTPDNFTSVSFESGRVNIRIINNLAFPLGKPMYVSILNVATGDTISTALLNEYIQPYGGECETGFDLSGKTLVSNMRVILFGSAAGTGGVKVPVTDNQGVDLQITLENITAVAAEALIPTQMYETIHYIDLSTDSLQINSAEIKSGSISFFVSSDFYLPVDIELFFPDILDRNMLPVTRIFHLFTRSAESVFIDLADTKINMKNGILKLHVRTTLLPDGEDFVSIQADDSYRASISVSELLFSQVIAAVRMNIDFPIIEEDILDTDVELPEIHLEESTLTLNFDNTPANMQVNLSLDGKNKIKQMTPANYIFDINGGIENNVVINNEGVRINGASSGVGGGLLDIINMMPDKMVFSGNVKIDDDFATITDRPVNIDYSLDVPLIFSLPETAVMDGDTTRLEFNDDKKMMDNIENVSLEIDIINGIALGGHLDVLVADSITAKNKPIAQWHKLSGFVFAPAACDLEGNTTQPNNQLLKIGLNSQAVQLLTASDYLIWQVTLDPIRRIKLKSTDRIILKNALLSGVMTVNKSIFENGDDE